MLEVNGNQYLLTKPQTVIGRGSGCDIVIDDRASPASTWRSTSPTTGVIARDLGSTNGTYVEGHQVPAATLLDGNTITIGRTPHPVLGLAGAGVTRPRRSHNLVCSPN